MTLQKFLEKFLPDYSIRDDVKELNDTYAFSKNAAPIILKEEATLEDKLFSEALQNFADNICEKQRELCADELTEMIFEEDDNLENVYYVVSDLGDIVYCKQPKIEEL